MGTGDDGIAKVLAWITSLLILVCSVGGVHAATCEVPVLFSQAIVHVFVLPYEGLDGDHEEQRFADSLKRAVVANVALPSQVGILAGTPADCDRAEAKQALLHAANMAQTAVVIVEGRLEKMSSSAYEISHRVEVRRAGLAAKDIAAVREFESRRVSADDLRALERDVTSRLVVRETPSASSVARRLPNDGVLAYMTAGTSGSWVRMISQDGLQGWLLKPTFSNGIAQTFPELGYVEDCVQRILRAIPHRQRLAIHNDLAKHPN